LFGARYLVEIEEKMSKIIVALDGMYRDEMVIMVGKLHPYVWGFKVNDALVRYGASIIGDLKAVGAQNVMADPKFFDIPNTVANGVEVLVQAGADFITVHSVAGAEVLKAAKKVAGECKILGITVLTSDNQENRDYKVRRNCYVLQSAEVDGLVCAASDLENIKDIPLFKVVPGIRPTGAVKGEDQVHISAMIPPLADYVVVGRALTQAEDPLSVIKKLEGEE
jgi:orotidine-5'-phosphate decarboxylase